MSAKKISHLTRGSRASRDARATASSSADPFASASGASSAMWLALAAPVVRAPSPTAKNTLLARVRAAKSNASQRLALPPIAGWRFDQIASGEDWVKLPLPGVRLREIALDAQRDTALLFIEMGPGSKCPDHDHSATERGLVLTGDLTMDGRLLRAGDFYEAAAGTRHERVASPSGCTGLLWVGAEAWRRWRAQAVA